MRAERYPVITTVPRNTLPQLYHKDIDAILKDFRQCSRRLKSALENFTGELQTLERLYYKCKNQHRMALFFKRVAEIRRYGRRLTELNILERVDLFRAAFLGLQHTIDEKALRRSWSHVPEKPHVDILIERVTTCSALVCKMRERLENGYRHFTLAIQTGAFVQVIVLFIAISSRMSELSSELREVLELGRSTCTCLLAIIHPAGATVLQNSPVEAELLDPSYTDHDVPSEDTGQPVSRCKAMDIPTPVVEEQGVKTEATIGSQVTPSPCHTEDSTDIIRNWVRTPAQPSDGTAVLKSRRPKKSKKKFDEIDEIFGF